MLQNIVKYKLVNLLSLICEEVKDLYNETQILMKEIKEGTTQWKDMFMNQKTVVTEVSYPHSNL